MDALNTYGLVFGVTIGILSAGTSFFNKQKKDTQIQILQDTSDALREQVSDLRLERTDIKEKLSACEARAEEREKVIDEYKRQPNFAELVTLINNNHKEVMTALAGKKNAKRP